MNKETETYTDQPIYKHYTLFCNNINESLKKDLEIQNKNSGIIWNRKKEKGNPSDWKPPSTYGLQNSERIIPEHWLSNQMDRNSITQNLEIDVFYELSKDIRNLKPLNETQLNFIQTLPKEKILELLEIYNQCFRSIEQLLS